MAENLTVTATNLREIAAGVAATKQVDPLVIQQLAALTADVADAVAALQQLVGTRESWRNIGR